MNFDLCRPFRARTVLYGACTQGGDVRRRINGTRWNASLPFALGMFSPFGAKAVSGKELLFDFELSEGVVGETFDRFRLLGRGAPVHIDGGRLVVVYGSTRWGG